MKCVLAGVVLFAAVVFGPAVPAEGGIHRRGQAAQYQAWQGQRAVAFARRQLGKAYRYGATGPRYFDCSGLTQAAWRRAGRTVPRVAADQYRRLKHVTRKHMRPGDLVFFRGLGHAGIFIGKGRYIHSPRTGDVVRVAELTGRNRRALVGAARP